MSIPPFKRLGVALWLGASVALAACSKKEEPTASVPYDSTKVEKKAVPAAEPAASHPTLRERAAAAAASAKADNDMKGLLRWADPPGWTRNKPSNPMRVAEYSIPKKGSDPENAELAINTFASGPGNTVEANIDRWVRQFEPQNSKEEVVKKDREVKGLKVHTVSLNGTYKGMMMPGSPASKPKSGYRLVGAVVELDRGLWFFKMTGPEATVKAAEGDFNKLIDSIHKSDAPAGSP